MHEHLDVDLTVSKCSPYAIEKAIIGGILTHGSDTYQSTWQDRTTDRANAQDDRDT
jgi:hypothetical protein